MKTKIIATIGPASVNIDVFNKLVAAGMDIARINTKYGSPSQYQKIIESVKKNKKCLLLFDIKGDEKLDWIKKRKFDYLALSFTESAKQIKDLRDYFKPQKVKIIAKIESKGGINKIDEIIDASDAVMVARGDLSENITHEKVPVFQKIIIKKCNRKKKKVITATEMLLSMTKSKTPEIAEVSDVANAVFDGTNFVMLSEETSIGKYPVEAVTMMRKIVTEIENYKKSKSNAKL